MKKLGGLCGAVLLLALAAGEASANTICLSKTNRRCFRTMTEALRLAQFGDTIRVESGVYTDTVQIPPLKSGIRIVGPKSAVFEAVFDGCVQDQPNDKMQFVPAAPFCAPNNADMNLPQFPPAVVLNGLPGFHIYAPDVQIVGITVRGGVSHGILVQSGMARVRIVDVTIENPNGTGILCQTNCPDLAIIKSEIVGAQVGVDVRGANVALDRVTVDGTTVGGGAIVGGSNAFVDRVEVIGAAGGIGVDVSTDNAIVTRNQVDTVPGFGVRVTGNDAFVAGNVTTNTVGGVQVTGNAPVVLKNRVGTSSGAASGVQVGCTTCTNGLVSGNRISDLTGTGDGLDIAAAGAGLVVDKNRVERVGGAGVDLTGSVSVALSKNQVTSAGTTTEPCFRIAASTSTVDRNKARTCAGEGFFVQGTGNALTSNQARDAGSDGFEVGQTSVGSVLTRNAAQSNQRYGFEVADGGSPASTTTLERNKGSKNALADLCEEGVATTLTNNSFATEATVVQNGVRDCVQ